MVMEEEQLKSWLGLVAIPNCPFLTEVLSSLIPYYSNLDISVNEFILWHQFPRKTGVPFFVECNQFGILLYLLCSLSPFLLEAMFSIRSEDVVRCGLNQLCSDVLPKGNLHTNDHGVFMIRCLTLHLVLWT